MLIGTYNVMAARSLFSPPCRPQVIMIYILRAGNFINGKVSSLKGAAGFELESIEGPYTLHLPKSLPNPLRTPSVCTILARREALFLVQSA